MSGAPAPASPPAARTHEPKPASVLGEWAKSLGVAALIFLCIRTFFLQTFVITSGSMENSLLVGDFLFANRLIFGPRIPGTTLHLPGYAHPERGDVVVFDPHHDIDQKLVKRLVGMPSDTLAMLGGVLFRNGHSQIEPYVKHVDRLGDTSAPEMAWQMSYLVDDADPAAYHPTRDNWGPLVVPDGHYFMLGDNRDDSYDSRYWGPLEEWRVEARVSFIYYSYDKTVMKPLPWFTATRWSRIGEMVE